MQILPEASVPKQLNTKVKKAQQHTWFTLLRAVWHLARKLCLVERLWAATPPEKKKACPLLETKFKGVINTFEVAKVHEITQYAWVANTVKRNGPKRCEARYRSLDAIQA